MKSKIYSRSLDDQAKIFTLASNKKYSSIFRFTVKLKEEVNREILQKAVELALEKYKVYKVKIKNGLFWHYLVENEMDPIILKETENPFKKVNVKENNKYLFRVTYIESRINLEVFHALTDGSGAIIFLKEILYRYLELKYPKELEFVKVNKEDIVVDSENAYIKNYEKKMKKTFKDKKAYQLQGEEVTDGVIQLKHYHMNLTEVKNQTKQMDCSLSMYIIAMIVYALYEGNYKTSEDSNPINLCVPVSLQKYFETNTMSNFVSHITVTLDLIKNSEYTFEKILDIVKEQFEIKLSKEKMVETISTESAMTHHPIINYIPLPLKKIAISLGSLKLKRNITMTISNLGKFDIDEKYSNYIDNILVILSPDWAEKMKCGICSYKDNLIVSFGTTLNNNQIEKEFIKILEKNNIRFKFETTNINNSRNS